MLNNVQDFEYEEQQSQNKFLKTYYGFCRYFEKNFALYLDSINFFNDKDWSRFRWEKQYCLTLFIKLASTLKASYDLTVKGYYAESITLTRTVYEALVRMIFIQKYPRRAQELMGKRFKMGEKEKELGIKHSSLYSLMSSFSHGHEIPVFFNLIDVQQGKIQGITIGPQPPSEENREFRIAVNMLMFYIWELLVLIVKSLPELLSDGRWKTKYDTLAQELEHKYIRTYLNVKGEPSNIALKGVDEVLGIIDSIPDWQR